MLDYIIVGSGIAGISFSEFALQHDKSIRVFNNDSQNSSKIAGGLYNPVILKRFSEVWKAKEQIDLLNVFYPQLEKRINCSVNNQVPVLRKFFSIEEQNNWFVSADKPNLAPFLSTELIFDEYDGITAPFGYGKVLFSGYLDTNSLLIKYQKYLNQHNILETITFDYSKLIIGKEYVTYNTIKAKNIVFAEGFGLHANPYFNYLPLDGTKGELLIIKSPQLKLECILNSSVFILPLGDGLFKVGATYNWKDKTDEITDSGKLELLERLEELIDCDFEVVEHLAGVRPTVRDRRPLVGTHADFKNVHVLNGLGTRGVMLGPYLAKALFNMLEHNISLDPEIDIIRYKKLQK